MQFILKIAVTDLSMEVFLSPMDNNCPIWRFVKNRKLPMRIAAMKSARPSLGRLMRRLRQRKKWTLREMSTRTGIPFSTLAKVEHDHLTLSYDKLVQLSERLGIRMSDLLADPAEDAEPAIARRSFGRRDRAVRLNTRNYDYFYLCAELRRKRMIPILTHIRAKSRDEFGELVRHAGEEYVHVLKGRVEVHTEFYDPIVLATGESIYIDSNMGHAYVAADGCEEAVVLGVCSSAAEDLMRALLDLHTDRMESVVIPDAARAATCAGAVRTAAPSRHTNRRQTRKA